MTGFLGNTSRQDLQACHPKTQGLCDRHHASADIASQTTQPVPRHRAAGSVRGLDNLVGAAGGRLGTNRAARVCYCTGRCYWQLRLTPRLFLAARKGTPTLSIAKTGSRARCAYKTTLSFSPTHGFRCREASLVTTDSYRFPHALLKIQNIRIKPRHSNRVQIGRLTSTASGR